MCAKIVLVGEAWGAKEFLFEHAFVGPSGVELARMLAETKLAPALAVQYPSELEMIAHWRMVRAEADIAVTNVFNLHPPDNKIETCFTNAKEGSKILGPLKAGKFVRPDLVHHVERLWRLLAEEEPNLVVAFGNTACWAMLNETKISVIRGTLKNSPHLGFKVLPTYHPAAVLHQWNLRTIVLADLEKACREAGHGDIRRIERWFTIEPTLDEIEAWLRRDAAYYAVDIETSLSERALGQIAMIGFARSDKDALVVPFASDQHPDWSYWPTIEQEMQAWRLVDKLLKKPVPKVFQNGIFDLSYILRSGLRPTMCQDDTMLLHHSLYPEMLKGLGFLGSVYSGEIAWKTMRTKGNNLKRDE
jgi:uracil-DNA glycosylase